MAASNILPGNVRAHLAAKSASAHSTLMKESEGNWQNSNNLVRLITTKMLDEMDPEESMSVNKVLALPTPG
jgi:hypothetical protein